MTDNLVYTAVLTTRLGPILISEVDTKKSSGLFGVTNGKALTFHDGFDKIDSLAESEKEHQIYIANLKQKRGREVDYHNVNPNPVAAVLNASKEKEVRQRSQNRVSRYWQNRFH